MKKRYFILVLLLFATFGLASCGKEPYDKVSMSINKTEVNLTLTKDQFTSELVGSEETIEVTVDSPKSLSKDIVLPTYGSGYGNEYVNIEKVDKGDGKTVLKLTASKQGYTEIEIKTLDGNITKVLKVNIGVAANSISFRDGLDLVMAVGSTLDLNYRNQQYIKYEPEFATDTDVTYYLAGDNKDKYADKVSLVGNVLAIADDLNINNLENLPSRIGKYIQLGVQLKSNEDIKATTYLAIKVIQPIKLTSNSVSVTLNQNSTGGESIAVNPNKEVTSDNLSYEVVFANPNIPAGELTAEELTNLKDSIMFGGVLGLYTVNSDYEISMAEYDDQNKIVDIQFLEKGENNSIYSYQISANDAGTYTQIYYLNYAGGNLVGDSEIHARKTITVTFKVVNLPTSATIQLNKKDVKTNNYLTIYDSYIVGYGTSFNLVDLQCPDMQYAIITTGAEIKYMNASGEEIPLNDKKLMSAKDTINLKYNGSKTKTSTLQLNLYCNIYNDYYDFNDNTTVKANQTYCKEIEINLNLIYGLQTLPTKADNGKLTLDVVKHQYTGVVLCEFEGLEPDANNPEMPAKSLVDSVVYSSNLFFHKFVGNTIVLYPNDEFMEGSSSLTILLTNGVYSEEITVKVEVPYAKDENNSPLWLLDLDTDNLGFMTYGSINKNKDADYTKEFNVSDLYTRESGIQQYTDEFGNIINYSTFNSVIVSTNSEIRLDVYRLFVYGGQVVKVNPNFVTVTVKIGEENSNKVRWVGGQEGRLIVGSDTTYTEGGHVPVTITFTIKGADLSKAINVYICKPLQSAKLEKQAFTLYDLYSIDGSGEMDNALFASWATDKVEIIVNTINADGNIGSESDYDPAEYGNIFQSYDMLNPNTQVYKKTDEKGTSVVKTFKDLLTLDNNGILLAKLNAKDLGDEASESVSKIIYSKDRVINFSGIIKQFDREYVVDFTVTIKKLQKTTSVNPAVDSETGVYFEEGLMKQYSFNYSVFPTNATSKKIFVDIQKKENGEYNSVPVSISYNGKDYLNYKGFDTNIYNTGSSSITNPQFEINITNGNVTIVSKDKAKPGTYRVMLSTLDSYTNNAFEVKKEFPLYIADGTLASPYQIRTAEQFLTFLEKNKEQSGKYYVIAKDIYLTKTFTDEVGSRDLDFASYFGTLQNHLSGQYARDYVDSNKVPKTEYYNRVVYGLKINVSSQTDVGLFSNIDAGITLKYLTLANVSIKAQNATNVGAIFAQVNEEVTIESCRVLGKIEVENTNIENANIGGLVGSVSKATITGLPMTGPSVNNSDINATISIKYTSNISGNIGGIAGSVSNANIDDIRVVPTITAVDTDGVLIKSNIGGVAGFAKTTNFNKIISYPSIIGHSNIGGIVGQMNGGYIAFSQVQMLYNANMRNVLAGYDNVGGVVGTLAGSPRFDYVYVRSYTTRQMGYFEKDTKDFYTDYVDHYYGAVVLFDSEDGGSGAGFVGSISEGNLTINDSYFASHINSFVKKSDTNMLAGVVGSVDKTTTILTIKRSYVDGKIINTIDKDIVNNCLKIVTASSTTTDQIKDNTGSTTSKYSIKGELNNTKNSYVVITRTKTYNDKIQEFTESYTNTVTFTNLYARLNNTVFGAINSGSLVFKGNITTVERLTMLIYNDGTNIKLFAKNENYESSPVSTTYKYNILGRPFDTTPGLQGGDFENTQLDNFADIKSFSPQLATEILLQNFYKQEIVGTSGNTNDGSNPYYLKASAPANLDIKRTSSIADIHSVTSSLTSAYGIATEGSIEEQVNNFADLLVVNCNKPLEAKNENRIKIVRQYTATKFGIDSVSDNNEASISATFEMVGHKDGEMFDSVFEITYSLSTGTINYNNIHSDYNAKYMILMPEAISVGENIRIGNGSAMYRKDEVYYAVKDNALYTLTTDGTNGGELFGNNVSYYTETGNTDNVSTTSFYYDQYVSDKFAERSGQDGQLLYLNPSDYPLMIYTDDYTGNNGDVGQYKFTGNTITIGQDTYNIVGDTVTNQQTGESLKFQDGTFAVNHQLTISDSSKVLNNEKICTLMEKSTMEEVFEGSAFNYFDGENAVNKFSYSFQDDGVTYTYKSDGWYEGENKVIDEDILAQLPSNLEEGEEYTLGTKYVYNNGTWQSDEKDVTDKDVLSQLPDTYVFADTFTIKRSNNHFQFEVTYYYDDGEWYEDEQYTYLVDEDVLEYLSNKTGPSYKLTTYYNLEDGLWYHEETCETLLDEKLQNVVPNYKRESDGNISYSYYDQDENEINVYYQDGKWYNSADDMENSDTSLPTLQENSVTYYYKQGVWYTDAGHTNKLTKNNVLDGLPSGKFYYLYDEDADNTDWYYDKQFESKITDASLLAILNSASITYETAIYYSFENKLYYDKEYENEVEGVSSFVNIEYTSFANTQFNFHLNGYDITVTFTYSGDTVSIASLTDSISIGNILGVANYEWYVKDGVIYFSDINEILGKAQLTVTNTIGYYSWLLTYKLNNSMPVMVLPNINISLDGESHTLESGLPYKLYYDELATLELRANDFIPTGDDYVAKTEEGDSQAHIKKDDNSVILMYNEPKDIQNENINEYKILFGEKLDGYYIATLNGLVVDLSAIKIDKENALQLIITSSDTSVATIDKDFTVKVLKTGETTFTFYNFKDDGIKVELKVYVIKGFTGYEVTSQAGEILVDNTIDVTNNEAYINSLKTYIDVTNYYNFNFVNRLNGQDYPANIGGFKMTIKSVDGVSNDQFNDEVNYTSVDLNGQRITVESVGDEYYFDTPVLAINGKNVCDESDVEYGEIKFLVEPYVMCAGEKSYIDNLAFESSIRVYDKAQSIAFAEDSATIMPDGEKSVAVVMLSNDKAENIRLYVDGEGLSDVYIEITRDNYYDSNTYEFVNYINGYSTLLSVYLKSVTTEELDGLNAIIYKHTFVFSIKMNMDAYVERTTESGINAIANGASYKFAVIPESVYTVENMADYTKYERYDDFDFNILPNSVDRIDTYFYANVNEPTENRYYSISNYIDMAKLAPGATGMLKIMISPAYNEVLTIEVNVDPAYQYYVDFVQIKPAYYSTTDPEGTPIIYNKVATDNIFTQNSIMLWDTPYYLSDLTENADSREYFFGEYYVVIKTKANIPQGVNIPFNIILRDADRKVLDISKTVPVEIVKLPQVKFTIDGLHNVIYGLDQYVPLDIQVSDNDGNKVELTNNGSKLPIYVSGSNGYEEVGTAELSNGINLSKKYFIRTWDTLGADATIGKYQFTVSTEKVINGVAFKSSDTVNLQVVRITLEDVGISGTNSGVITMKTGYYQGLQVDVETSKPETESTYDISNLIETLKNNISGYGDLNKNHWYFEDAGVMELMRVGTMYGGLEFTFDDSEAINRFRLNAIKIGSWDFWLDFPYYYDNNGEIIVANVPQGADYTQYRMNRRFTIVVKDNSSEEAPIPITNISEFLDMQPNVNYILQTDITLQNWTPISFEARYLDGNGFTIRIESFNLTSLKGKEEAVYAGIFTTIAEGSSIRNLNIDISSLLYNDTELNQAINEEITPNIDLRQTSEVYFGVVAGSNEGSIINVKVVNLNARRHDFSLYVGVSRKYFYVGDEYRTSQGYIGGLVGSNYGVITNSYIGSNNDEGSEDGRVQVTKKNGDTWTSEFMAINDFNLVANNNLAGFAYINGGTISNSFVNSLDITNTTRVSDNSSTAGFVGTNSGKIQACAVTSKDIIQEQVSFTENGTSKTVYKSTFRGDNVITSGAETAGFVYKNSGIIQDSYTIVAINNKNVQTAGFAMYHEGAEARIVNSYTTSKNIASNLVTDGTGNTNSHSMFLGQDKGYAELENCYYLILGDELGDIDNLSEDVLSALDPAIALKFTAGSPIEEENFNGFTFASDDKSYDGIWANKTNKFPELQYAENNQYYTSRKLSNIPETRFEVLADGNIKVIPSGVESASTITLGENATSFTYRGVVFTLEKDGNIVNILENKNPLIRETDTDGSVKYVYNKGESANKYSYITNNPGSLKNPLIVTNAEEFVRNIVSNSQKYTYGDKVEYIFGMTENEGHGANARYVQIVDNITFDETSIMNTYEVANSTDVIAIHQLIFNGVIVGNAMTLSNITLVLQEKMENFGIFKEVGIRDELRTDLVGGNVTIPSAIVNANIFNLDLQYSQLSNTLAEKVGLLAGTISNSTVSKISITGTQSSNEEVEDNHIKGGNLVGGLAGLIVGDANNLNISEIVVSNIATESTSNSLAGLNKEYIIVDQSYSKFALSEKNPIVLQTLTSSVPRNNMNAQTGVTYKTTDESNSLYSYAGSIAGAIITYNGYDDNRIIEEGDDGNLRYKDLYDTTSSIRGVGSDNKIEANIQNMTAKGNISVKADLAGGLFGYVGGQSYIYNTKFELTDDDQGQYIWGYGYAGGIVAHVENSILSKAVVAHSELAQDTDSDDNNTDSVQVSIDKRINTLDQTAGNKVSSNTIFTQNGVSNYNVGIGGIIGYANNIYLVDSTAKVNVINSNSYIAGGVIGRVDNRGYLSHVYTIGNVEGKNIFGGIVGYYYQEDEEIKQAYDLSMYNVFGVNVWSSSIKTILQINNKILYDTDAIRAHNQNPANAGNQVKDPIVVLPEIGNQVLAGYSDFVRENLLYSGTDWFRYFGSVIGRYTSVQGAPPLEVHNKNDFIDGNNIFTTDDALTGVLGYTESVVHKTKKSDTEEVEEYTVLETYNVYYNSKTFNVISSTYGLVEHTGNFEENTLTSKIKSDKLPLSKFDTAYTERANNGYDNHSYTHYNRLLGKQYYISYITGDFINCLNEADDEKRKEQKALGNKNYKNEFTTNYGYAFVNNDKFDASKDSLGTLVGKTETITSLYTKAKPEQSTIWHIEPEEYLAQYGYIVNGALTTVTKAGELNNAFKSPEKNKIYELRRTVNEGQELNAENNKFVLATDSEGDGLAAGNIVNFNYIQSDVTYFAETRATIEFKGNSSGDAQNQTIFDSLKRVTFMNINFIIHADYFESPLTTTGDGYFGFFANIIQNCTFINCDFTIIAQNSLELNFAENASTSIKEFGMVIGRVMYSSFTDTTFKVEWEGSEHGTLTATRSNDNLITAIGGFAGVATSTTIRNMNYDLSMDIKLKNMVNDDTSPADKQLAMGGFIGLAENGLFVNIDNNQDDNTKNDVNFEITASKGSFDTKTIFTMGGFVGKLRNNDVIVMSVNNEGSQQEFYLDTSLEVLQDNGIIKNVNFGTLAGISEGSTLEKIVVKYLEPSSDGEQTQLYLTSAVALNLNMGLIGQSTKSAKLSDVVSEIPVKFQFTNTDEESDTTVNVGGMIGYDDGNTHGQLVVVRDITNLTMLTNKYCKTLNIGGFVGQMSGGSITTAYSLGDIIDSTYENTKIAMNIGGVVGLGAKTVAIVNTILYGDIYYTDCENKNVLIGGVIGNANKNSLSMTNVLAYNNFINQDTDENWSNFFRPQNTDKISAGTPILTNCISGIANNFINNGKNTLNFVKYIEEHDPATSQDLVTDENDLFSAKTAWATSEDAQTEKIKEKTAISYIDALKSSAIYGDNDDENNVFITRSSNKNRLAMLRGFNEYVDKDWDYGTKFYPAGTNDLQNVLDTDNNVKYRYVFLEAFTAEYTNFGSSNKIEKSINVPAGTIITTNGIQRSKRDPNAKNYFVNLGDGTGHTPLFDENRGVISYITFEFDGSAKFEQNPDNTEFSLFMNKNNGYMFNVGFSSTINHDGENSITVTTGADSGNSCQYSLIGTNNGGIYGTGSAIIYDSDSTITSDFSVSMFVGINNGIIRNCYANDIMVVEGTAEHEYIFGALAITNHGVIADCIYGGFAKIKDKQVVASTKVIESMVRAEAYILPDGHQLRDSGAHQYRIRYNIETVDSAIIGTRVQYSPQNVELWDEKGKKLDGRGYSDALNLILDIDGDGVEDTGENNSTNLFYNCYVDTNMTAMPTKVNQLTGFSGTSLNIGSESGLSDKISDKIWSKNTGYDINNGYPYITNGAKINTKYISAGHDLTINDVSFFVNLIKGSEHNGISKDITVNMNGHGLTILDTMGNISTYSGTMKITTLTNINFEGCMIVENKGTIQGNGNASDIYSVEFGDGFIYKNSGTVQNLDIENVKLVNKDMYFSYRSDEGAQYRLGLLVGVNANTIQNITMTECHIEYNPRSTKDKTYKIGLVAGVNANNANISESISLIDCSISKMDGDSAYSGGNLSLVGGVVGDMYSDTTTTNANGLNAKINVSGLTINTNGNAWANDSGIVSQNGGVGGIAGRAYGVTVTLQEGSKVAGSITISEYTGSDARNGKATNGNIGGIIGTVSNKTKLKGVFDSSVNITLEGDNEDTKDVVEPSAEAQNVGGIIGYIGTTSSDDKKKVSNDSAMVDGITSLSYDGNIDAAGAKDMTATAGAYSYTKWSLNNLRELLLYNNCYDISTGNIVQKHEYTEDLGSWVYVPKNLNGNYMFLNGTLLPNVGFLSDLQLDTLYDIVDVWNKNKEKLDAGSDPTDIGDMIEGEAAQFPNDDEEKQIQSIMSRWSKRYSLIVQWYATGFPGLYSGTSNSNAKSNIYRHIKNVYKSVNMAMLNNTSEVYNHSTYFDLGVYKPASEKGYYKNASYHIDLAKLDFYDSDRGNNNLATISGGTRHVLETDGLTSKYRWANITGSDARQQLCYIPVQYLSSDKNDVFNRYNIYHNSAYRVTNGVGEKVTVGLIVGKVSGAEWNSTYDEKTIMNSLYEKVYGIKNAISGSITNLKSSGEMMEMVQSQTNDDKPKGKTIFQYATITATFNVDNDVHNYMYEDFYFGGFFKDISVMLYENVTEALGSSYKNTETDFYVSKVTKNSTVGTKTYTGEKWRYDITGREDKISLTF